MNWHPVLEFSREELRLNFWSKRLVFKHSEYAWLRSAVRLLRRERVRFKRTIPPAQRKAIRQEQEKEKNEDIYATRSIKLGWRYTVYVIILIVAVTQLISLFSWSWINPYSVFSWLMLFALGVAVWAFVFANIGQLLIVVFRAFLGMDIGSTGRKYRNSIYVVTLSYFALQQRDALSEISSVVPFETLQTEPEIENLLVLASAYIWINFVAERLFDSKNWVDGSMPIGETHSSAVPSAFVFSIIALLFNTLIPFSLTYAMFSTFEFSALMTISNFSATLVETVIQAQIPFVSAIIEAFTSDLPAQP